MIRPAQARHTSRRPRRSLRPQTGAVAVEFGLLLPVLLILFGGMVEMGHALYEYDTLTKASRNATRYLSEYSPSDPTYPIAAAKCLAVSGTTDCSGAALAPDLSTANVVICDRSNPTDANCQDLAYGNYTVYDTTDNNAGAGSSVGTINLVAVKIVNYQYTPIQGILNFAGLVFGDIATVMRQVL
ncbi:TadE/TadG family type IV pilus assembly protein [Pandoraea pulmonicola]|uniref:Pilus assembly protein TadG n=1 Tax=Pandoraea pulmonicola TaxID=93221 RepID=A0AAJ4ZCA2_PANPU|nr:TadE/TadG family type IV pilus assembly protein [Pandoraea pulmonicola]AJC20720.2 pilus assembly protein TadG [Pandoraea pulmonicola]SUA90767.1 Flp pilus assembly protein TadG [Pandoraea pulmonicola]